MIENEALKDAVIRGPGAYKACYFEHCTFDVSTGQIITQDCYFERCWGIPPEVVTVGAIFSDDAPTFWDRLMDECFHRCIR